jgi:hypothetical protein
VQNNIVINVNNYLQNHMFTLALLPNSWKSGGDGKKSERASPPPSSPLSDSSSSSSLATRKAQLSEAEKKKNRETVEVLFEQKAQIDTFIAKFKKEGKNDEVATLQRSKKELDTEIKRLQSLS